MANLRKLDQLGKLIAQGEQLFMQWAKQQHINYHIFIIYDALYCYGECTQKQICQEWGIPKQTLSTLCRQLYQQGDIDFKEGSDKREKLMYFTEQGKQKATPLVEKFTQLQEQAFSQLGEEKTQQLIEHLTLLNQYFAQYIAKG